MKHDILTQIIDHKKEEVALQRKQLPTEVLIRQLEVANHLPQRSMKQAILDSKNGIIAEFKRKMPSKSEFHREDALISEVLPSYEIMGAAACSILTDQTFFGGSIEDLMEARKIVDLPLLRKEFIISDYQIYESRLIGADAILLIARVLGPERCHAYATLAKRLGLEVLLEIHQPEELACLSPHVDMLGINNRNLSRGETFTQCSLGMIGEVRSYLAEHPERHTNPVLISESGIHQGSELRALREQGFRGFLIGWNFMRMEDPGKMLRRFMISLDPQMPCSSLEPCNKHIFRKVCGLREPENMQQVVAAGANAVGLIFVSSSPRYIEPKLNGNNPSLHFYRALPCWKVGVFKNEDELQMKRIAEQYALNCLQLHGEESPLVCWNMQQLGFIVIKAISIETKEDLAITKEYEGYVDYFLFDTKCPEGGGSGKSFDWSVLATYQGNTPFILGGGLSPDSVEELRRFHHPCWAGVDLNSGFETAPGRKDAESVKQFFAQKLI